MPRTKTKAFLISIILLDLLFVAIFVALYMFTKNQIASTINSENQIRNEIKREETLSLMKKDIEDSKNYEDKIYGYFIGTDNVADFLKTIEGLVSSSSLKSDIQSVAYESSGKATLVGTELVRVRMNVHGEWKNTQYFLKLLENYPFKIDIKSVSLNRSSEKIVSGRIVPEWLMSVDFTVVKLKNI